MLQAIILSNFKPYRKMVHIRKSHLQINEACCWLTKNEQLQFAAGGQFIDWPSQGPSWQEVVWMKPKIGPAAWAMFCRSLYWIRKRTPNLALQPLKRLPINASRMDWWDSLMPLLHEHTTNIQEVNKTMRVKNGQIDGWKSFKSQSHLHK